MQLVVVLEQFRTTNHWTRGFLRDQLTKHMEFQRRFVRACNENIKQTLALVAEMIELADKGDADREDVGCGIIYGILRDSAYKLKQLAEKEKAAHMEKGWWDTDTN